MDLSEILGMGYQGAAVLQGMPVRLIGGSYTEESRFQQASGSWTHQRTKALGQPVARGRIGLKISLTCEVTPKFVEILKDICWASFDDATYSKARPLEFYIANKLGVTTDHFYLESVTLASQQDSVLTATINGRAWVFNYSDYIDYELPPVYLPLASEWAPIPHWQTCASHTAVTGICRSWSVTFEHNLQERFLCEGRTEPADPKYIYSGELGVNAQFTVLAKRGSNYVPEVGTMKIKVRGKAFGMTSSAVVCSFVLPNMIKTPNHSWMGIAQPNSPLELQTSWVLVGDYPRDGD